jgi:hypothetical protein
MRLMLDTDNHVRPLKQREAAMKFDGMFGECWSPKTPKNDNTTVLYHGFLLQPTAWSMLGQVPCPA